VNAAHDLNKTPTISISSLQRDSYANPNTSEPDNSPKGIFESDVIIVNPDSYPLKFRPLVKAILQLSNNRTNTRVGFIAVRNLIGNKEIVQAPELGWMNFKQMLNQAKKENCIQQGKDEGDKWVILLTVCSVQET
jgi:hypothetical protein